MELATQFSNGFIRKERKDWSECIDKPGKVAQNSPRARLLKILYQIWADASHFRIRHFAIFMSCTMYVYNVITINSAFLLLQLLILKDKQQHLTNFFLR